jgi:hypothetical protein
MDTGGRRLEDFDKLYEPRETEPIFKTFRNTQYNEWLKNKKETYLNTVCRKSWDSKNEPVMVTEIYISPSSGRLRARIVTESGVKSIRDLDSLCPTTKKKF